MANIVVCYHYPCNDGIFAALAAHLHHKRLGNPVKYIPMTVYQAPQPLGWNLKGTEDVYMLDYAGPEGLPEQLAEMAHRVIILDHHKTAAERLSNPSSLPSNVDVVFDMERSGATIARDYFQPVLTPEQNMLFRYIEDGDLWRWRLPDSKAFQAGLAALKLEMDATVNPAIFDRLVALTAEDVISLGKTELEQQQRKIDSAIQSAYPIQLGGEEGVQRGWGTCLCAAVGLEVAKLRSELGNQLAAASQQQGREPAGVVAYQEAELDARQSIKLSFRTLGALDSTAWSQAYGGGGHRNASSCIIPMEQFDTWRSHNSVSQDP